MLEPELAVLWVEARLCEVAEELWLAGELLAEGGACGGAEGGDCGEDREEPAGADVDEGVVPVQSYERRCSLFIKVPNSYQMLCFQSDKNEED